jgi:hypothetical protein
MDCPYYEPEEDWEYQKEISSQFEYGAGIAGFVLIVVLFGILIGAILV